MESRIIDIREDRGVHIVTVGVKQSADAAEMVFEVPSIVNANNIDVQSIADHAAAKYAAGEKLIDIKSTVKVTPVAVVVDPVVDVEVVP